MIRTIRRVRWSFPLLASLLLACAPASAEVSVREGALRFENPVFFSWAPAQPDAAGPETLNPYGDARGDGVPVLALNPVTRSPEVAWGVGGASPCLAFARFDANAGAWSVARVPAARSGSRWIGRTPQLAHDSQGNSYLLYEDAESGQVLLASVARGSLRVNPPMILATPQRPGTSPSMLWDGDELVVAFVRADAPESLEVHGLTPEWDADGRIPDGGEGIPGIPEPIFGAAGMPGDVITDRPLGGGAGGPGLGGLSPSVSLDLDLPPPLLRLEALSAGRLLVSWIAGDRLLWSLRVGDSWSEPDWIELPNPRDHEQARRRLRQQLGGPVQPSDSRAWELGRRVPDAMEQHERRR